jgi:hypothetical protein
LNNTNNSRLEIINEQEEEWEWGYIVRYD